MATYPLINRENRLKGGVNGPDNVTYHGVTILCNWTRRSTPLTTLMDSGTRCMCTFPTSTVWKLLSIFFHQIKNFGKRLQQPLKWDFFLNLSPLWEFPEDFDFSYPLYITYSQFFPNTLLEIWIKWMTRGNLFGLL